MHRDIKPANVMVTRSGQVKVMDFGIARAISDSSATVAQTTAILGTAQYFSPEQAKGETVDPRSDLYSTGIVLFEMLTGRAPFRGDSPIAVAYQHVSEPRRPPAELTPASPRAWTPSCSGRSRRTRTTATSPPRSSARTWRRSSRAGPPRTAARDRSGHRLFGGAGRDARGDGAPQLAFDDSEHVTHLEPSARSPGSGRRALRRRVVLAVALWVVSASATGGFGADQRTIPTGLAGSTETSAVSALDKLDLHPLVHHMSDDEVPSGEVIRTSPGAAPRCSRTPRSRSGSRPGSPKVTVPTLQGLSLDAAQKAITSAGLQNGSIITQHSKDVPKDVVMSADPRTACRSSKGTTVDLTVSDGQVQLASEIGKPKDEASADLSDLGLTPNLVGIGGLRPRRPTVVIGQKEAAGRRPSGLDGDAQLLRRVVSRGSSPAERSTASGSPTALQPVREHAVAALGHHRLRMELHAVDRRRAVLQRP